jgi:hypothetical protein
MNTKTYTYLAKNDVDDDLFDIVEKYINEKCIMNYSTVDNDTRRKTFFIYREIRTSIKQYLLIEWEIPI